MRVLIDTNLFVDWLNEREPFAKDSEEVISMCLDGRLEGYIASHTFPDLSYILRKNVPLDKQREIFIGLCEKFTVIAENQQMLLRVFKNIGYKDIEDGLQMECATVKDLDYIITRNIKDFTASKVETVSPEVFLYRYSKL